MLSGIRDILIITTPEDKDSFRNLLGDGSSWGINFSYEIQPKPEGIAQALIIGEKFLDNNPSVLMLGDNIFYGSGFAERLKNANNSTHNILFSYKVPDPNRFGVCSLDNKRKVIGLEEKPENPSSNLAVTGLYFYDSNASHIAKNIKPSQRGELEITDVNIEYMNSGSLYSDILGEDFTWIDAGTHQSFIDASNFVYAFEKRYGQKIACPEEIAFKKGFISAEQLESLSNKLKNSLYGQYLLNLLD